MCGVASAMAAPCSASVPFILGFHSTPIWHFSRATAVVKSAFSNNTSAFSNIVAKTSVHVSAYTRFPPKTTFYYYDIIQLQLCALRSLGVSQTRVKSMRMLSARSKPIPLEQNVLAVKSRTPSVLKRRSRHRWLEHARGPRELFNYSRTRRIRSCVEDVIFFRQYSLFFFFCSVVRSIRGVEIVNCR